MVGFKRVPKAPPTDFSTSVLCRVLAKQIIKKEEGYSAVPYLCSEGYVTIGYGTKLHKVPHMDPLGFCFSVDEAQSDIWLNKTIETDYNKLSTVKGKAFTELSAVRKAILLSMCYQMGARGIFGFHATWKAIGSRDFERARLQMLNSRWAEQTSNRANRHANAMLTGVMPEFYER